MSTKAGRSAESAVADYLAALKIKVVEANWRNRWCEIDLIAKSADCYHFIEVKYRSRQEFGHGFEYVTTAKQQRLRRAAEAYLFEHNLDGSYQIDVAAVTGDLGHPQIDYLANAIEAD